MPTIAPYGSWKSPITSDLIVAKAVGLGGLTVEGKTIYWTESRPDEKGRTVVIRRSPDGQTTDLNPPPYYARTRVHEYGGGEYMVHHGVTYFSNFADQRVYRLSPGAEPVPITPAIDLRYADGVMDMSRGRIIYVREDHTAGNQDAVNTIVALDAGGADTENGGKVLVSGNDFYSNPRISPDGSRLAWLTWNHSNMPWDGTELWLAEIAADGSLVNAACIAGGLSESIFQPSWSPDGRLYFISDRSGWWNLYRWNNAAYTAEALHPMEAEFGEPAWVFGQSTYAFESAERMICAYGQNGENHLATLDTHSLEFHTLDLPFTDFAEVQASSGMALFCGGSPTHPWSIIYLDLASGKTEVLKRGSGLDVDPGYLSIPQSIEFPTENGLTAFGIYYPPTNTDFRAPDGEKPPLRVLSHGGPTGSSSTTLRLGIQYWTSRGFAILDVNYGGSTGYGRAYRERLKGQWGVVDVDDCVNGALYLARQGLADEKRLAIEGGSAGGYTTLCALAFRKVFQAGASHFGVSDAEALALDTHKFESRYLDGLIGPYPEAKELYIQRSPIHFTHQLDCALILFQGSEDKVVPPEQSRKMFEAVRAKELPVAYLEFEGEQHGFRKSENIKRSLDAELYFYARVFKFTLAEEIEPVTIENL
jgi:dipeptidyl aminopeptidase/acylaminoacyl peptidase